MTNTTTAARAELVAESAPRATSARWAVAGLSLTMLLSSLDTSIANVALPTLAETFAASFRAVQWVVLANLLSLTALIVSVGRLGDLIGRRRLLLAGILLFMLASTLSGLAPALGWLIVARAVQGVGGAIMMALALALVGETVPKTKMGGAIGLLGTMSAIGTALGPSLGGLLIAGLGWRAVFLVNVPMGLAAFLLVRRHLPADRLAPQSARIGFDHTGTLLLAATLASYALGVTLWSGRFGVVNAALLGAAVVGAGLFVLVESRAAAPLIRLAMFSERGRSANLVTSALVATVVTATLVVGPFYLSRALGFDAVRVGLVLSIGPLVAALTAMPAGRLADRFGAQRMTIAGLVAMAAGSFALSLLPTAVGLAGFIASVVVVTAGYGIFQTANNTAVMSNLRPDQRGGVSGLLNLSRNLGRITGASVMGTVFTLAVGTTDLAAAAPAAVATGMRVTFASTGFLVVAVILIAANARGRTTRVSRIS